MSSNKKEKEERERIVFGLFLKERGLPCSPDFFKSMDPPAPDILYAPDNEVPTAFELVEFCDKKIASAGAKDLLKGTCTFIRTSDPSVEILINKSKKFSKYKSDYPIELLCYTNGRLVSPDDYVIDRIRCYPCFQDNTFRRVWFFGKKAHVVFERTDT